MKKLYSPDKMQLLLLSEDERNAEAFIPFLERDFDIIYATDKLEGLSAFKEKQIDCIVIDFSGPTSPFCSLIEQIRQCDVLTPIYITTDNTSLDWLERCATAGINGLFKSPFDAQEVLGRIIKNVSAKSSVNIHRSYIIEMPNCLESFSKQVQATLHFIHENFFRTITKKEIVKVLSINPDYLGRIFKKECGISISKYTSNLRVEKSKELLKDRTMTISEVAEMVGFQNENYFYVLFRELTGMSPREFRKKRK